jgi:hypothetical protein
MNNCHAINYKALRCLEWVIGERDYLGWEVP